MSNVIPIKTVYKTTSGKLQRYKLLEKYNNNEFNSIIQELNNLKDNSLDSKNNVMDIILTEATDILGTNIDINKPLMEQGFTSISLISFKDRISKKLKLDIDITTIFDYPTVKSFVDFISNNSDKDIELNDCNKNSNEIAIISVACRFPDANTPELFFDNLSNGIDSIKKSQRWDKEYFGGFLNEDILENFDNEFFNISPAEAQSLDPQVRILLQTSLELLERGVINYNKEKNIALFLGASSNDNLRLSLDKGVDTYTLTSNLLSTLTGRVSYHFDFNAPVLTIDTACSSSLVAIHQAINSINNGECKMAIAGGVNILLDNLAFDGLSKMQALSPTYRCNTFDESADGYVRGEGCGLVLLKPLSDAIKDNNEILAVIKSSRLNHDGKSNGLTSPNGLAQQQLLKKAYQNIDRVDYIETHGTGTNLGDPIEVNALSSVFKEQNIALGAVKTNIGHLESSAGIAGVIKVIMSMKHNKIPANLNLKNKNKFINWDTINLEPLTNIKDWNSNKLKVAGVSSFGFSGTNAHIVLEEFKYDDKPKNINNQYKILLISAKTKNSAEILKNNYLESINLDNADDFLYTASKKYKYNSKIAIIGKDINDIKEQKIIYNSNINIQNNYKIVFVFTGQGSQYLNMGKELFNTNDIFKRYFLECDNIFKQYLDKSLVDVIYKENDNSLLNEPIYTQSSIFAIEYAISKYLIDLNIKPDAVCGHSLGEYVASVISEVLSLEDAIRLVVLTYSP